MQDKKDRDDFEKFKKQKWRAIDANTAGDTELGVKSGKYELDFGHPSSQQNEKVDVKKHLKEKIPKQPSLAPNNIETTTVHSTHRTDDVTL